MLTLLTSFNIEKHIFPALRRVRAETPTSQFFEQLSWAQKREQGWGARRSNADLQGNM